MEKGKTVTIAQACGMLNILPSTLYRWQQAGKIRIAPATQAGVVSEDIERILANRKEAGK